MIDDTRFDARVRSALQALPPPSEQDTNLALREMLRHRRPRRQSSWLVAAAASAAAAAITILVVVVPFFGSDRRNDPAPPIVTPSPTPSVEGVWHRDLRGADEPSWNGSWAITLRPDGVLLLDGPPAAENVSDGAAFAVSDGQLRVDVLANDACTDLPPGVYEWSRTGRRLTLVVLSEPCGARKDLLAGTWTR